MKMKFEQVPKPQEKIGGELENLENVQEKPENKGRGFLSKTKDGLVNFFSKKGMAETIGGTALAIGGGLSFLTSAGLSPQIFEAFQREGARAISAFGPSAMLGGSDLVSAALTITTIGMSAMVAYLGYKMGTGGEKKLNEQKNKMEA